MLYSEKLNYADYVEKVLPTKSVVLLIRHTGDNFGLSSSSAIIASSFEARQFVKLPSDLILVQSVLKRMPLLPLAYGIVSASVGHITNQVLTLKQDCV